MTRLVQFSAVLRLMSILSAAFVCAGAELPKQDLEFLKQLTVDVIDASSVAPGSNGGGRWPLRWPLTNSCGFRLITPGKDTYTAFWIRDFSMALDSGLIPAHDVLNHLLLICRTQNGPTERKLAHGLHIPAWAIPDHINYNGKASFYPGTYASGDEQGDGTFGRRPPVDDHYEFVHIAYVYLQQTHDAFFLKRLVDGLTIFERVQQAFAVPEVDPTTGLVQTSEEDRAVGFGFCDAEVHTGKLLFASLLRYRAARELLVLARRSGDPEVVSRCERIQSAIAASLYPTFGDSHSGGWLRASTGASGQADVWGTLFALHLNILKTSEAAQARAAVAEGVKAGTITYEGGVRQVPTNLDYSTRTSWQRSLSPLNTYQNGGYWHTASGWLIEALWMDHPALAEQVFREMISHLRSQDYRRGPSFGAPWEVYGRNKTARQNPVYMASVALPYGILSGFAGDF